MYSTFNDFESYYKIIHIQICFVGSNNFIRENSLCKLEHCRFKTLFVLYTDTKIHSTALINVKPGKLC